MLAGSPLDVFYYASRKLIKASYLDTIYGKKCMHYNVYIEYSRMSARWY